MKVVLKVLLGIVIVLVVVVVGALIYFNMTFPKVGPPEAVTVEITDAAVDRGEYLANYVTVCIDCHSKRDWRYFSGPPTPGTEGAGGEEFTEEMGFPGDYYAPNITPTNLADWTDGEIIRAITTGVNKDGKVIFPVMPYHNYGKMDEDDVHAIVAYLRSLDPKQSEIPERRVAFPLNMILKTIPQPADPMEMPAKEDTVEYGRYLTMIAACGDCHTPVNDKQQYVEGMYMAGGREFNMPGGTLRTPNLTSDEDTGLGGWDRELFIDRFKMYQQPEMQEIEIDPTSDYMTIMPWIMYSGMTDEDLGAIFAYLETVKPVQNNIVRWEPRAVPAPAE